MRGLSLRQYAFVVKPLGRRFYLLFAAMCAIMLATGMIQQWLPGRVLFFAGLILFAVWWFIAARWFLSGVANLFRVWEQRRSWFRWLTPPPIVSLLVIGGSGHNPNFWIARPA